jgi:hypothetical protein
MVRDSLFFPLASFHYYLFSICSPARLKDQTRKLNPLKKPLLLRSRRRLSSLDRSVPDCNSLSVVFTVS